MNTETNTTPIPSVNNDDEIDLMALAKTIWNGRKTIFKAILIAGIIGVFIALVSPKEYTASTTMVPQTKSSNKLGGLSSLAAMAGFNLDNMGSGGETMSPMVYPQIVQSVPFQLELMEKKFTFSEVSQPVSLYEYYTNIAKPGVLATTIKYTVGLPGLLISSLKGDSEKTIIGTEKGGPISLTKKQENVRKILDSKVILTVDAKQGYLTLTASFPEALLSAQVADQARELLQKYITKFKIDKVADQLAFIEGRYTEKKKEFEKAQERLARFRDQNKNVTSAIFRTEEERLQSEYTIAMNVYNELAKQLEQAKIQVKEETPVFSVLEPAAVPQEKTKPKRSMILMIWLFLGGIAGTGWVFGKEYFVELKKKWKETE